MNVRFLIIAFATASLFTPVAISQSQNTDAAKEAAAKLQPGTYYWTDGVWRSMERINMSGGGAKHVGKMFVPGLTPQIVYTYRGPSAPVQVKEDKPLFCVKFIAGLSGTPYAPSARDITIARFDEKKDHRELQITSGGNVLTFKAGLGKDRLPDLTLTPLAFLAGCATPCERVHHLNSFDGI